MTREQIIEIADKFNEWLDDIVVKYEINETDLLVLEFHILRKLIDNKMIEEQIIDEFDKWFNDLVTKYKVNETDLLILKFRIFEKLTDRINNNTFNHKDKRSEK